MFHRRKTSLALQNILANPTRAAVSVAGVGFALLLIFVQLGFRHAVSSTASLIFDELDFDVVIRSSEYLHLYEARSVDRKYLDWVAGQPEVERVDPFWITLTTWENISDNSVNAIAMMAMPAGRNLFLIPEVEEKYQLLNQSHAVLMDRASKKDFGPKNGKKFGPLDVGEKAVLGMREVTIAGDVLVGTGLATNGALLISDSGFALRWTEDLKHRASLGLVKLKAGQNPNQAVDALKHRMQESDPQILDYLTIQTKREMIAWEHRRWLRDTPIGIIFQIGVALAFLVGAAVVYMVLAQDVARKLPEYATLKAMGYSPVYLCLVVLQQAWILSVAGWIPAVVVADLLYRITSYFAEIPIESTVGRMVGVAALSVLMCTLSGIGALRKIFRAEPASLF